ncbi:hypothetical protein N0V82_003367 [Gnomoniopsis sp. IMI 355080]|nr:hypothetical protein N0V82_003367 [Gnomoniopsis sp. IMI 355080]
MNDLQAMQTPRDDWEDWSDDDTVASIRHNNNPFMQSASANTKSSSQSTTNRRSKPRQSSSKLQRLKSRKRQKHQNEKLGIRLVTDLTDFRKGPHHVAQLVHPATGPASSEANINKFADASALRALEGSPNLASVGNWAWLRDNQSPATPSPDSQHYSPNGNKIVIGMAMPEQDAANRAISPQTATIATPTNRLPTQSAFRPSDNHHQNSTWSPDTEDGYSPARYLQNIYAQSTGPASAHPVPAIPSHLKNSTKANEVDDDDNFTPVTLFEEDGRKSPNSAISKISPETTRSRSGWWDHVKTPFKERFSPTSPNEWWKGADKKTAQMPQQDTAADASSSSLRPIVPIIREPSPTMASSSRSSPPSSINEHQQESRSEKAGVVMEEHADPADVPPPYEHTPSSKQDVRLRAVFPPGHYLADQFPPSPMPGSPGVDKSMTAQGDVKMAYMKMSDVPLTPARTGAESTHSVEQPLPDRVAGTYVGDQHQDVQGDSPAAQIEKTRRRHEKEDYLARKVGGAWKGRGCLNGCYGRSGREGRQRRRLWMWVCLVFWLVTILAVVLGVVLSHKLAVVAAPASDASGSSATSSPDTTSSDTPEKTSVWLNLTSFPAIPTGLATVVGADNSEAITGCVAPETLWSCSLPPEQQAANEPSDANQPMFIFQIQYDNNTRMLWDIPNGDAPTPATSASSTTTSATSTSTLSASSTSSGTSTATSATATDDLTGSDPGRRLLRRDDTLYDTGIAPNPAPPSYDEMWFLGNWTDDIVSANKSGEPTPFYISFFTSLNGSAGANMLTDDSSTTTKSKSKRGGVGAGDGSTGTLTDALPAPIVNADGTGAAAQLRPFPYQQPLRLYDRGLPTEHYGFYSYFNKTIYVSTMDNTSTVTSSNEGGVLETSAAWYATWTQTRFVVKIWTQKTASSNARLIGGGGASSSNTTSPGSFPYPITIGEDTHGGDLQLKQTFAYAVEADQVINTTLATTFVNNIGYGADVVNAAYPNGDLSWGGTDGGKGGCRCEWVNWVDAEGNADETFG